MFDIVGKLRELDLAGDRDATALLADFERIRLANDVAASLRFEKGLLTVARDQFELISHQEYADLERLQEDRHRCAHPSMSTEMEAYRPAPELVRYHLHSAATHLLVRPPVQGKAALDRLMAQVQSDYFPDTIDNATTVLQQGPLARAKFTLIRNFLIATLKALTNGTFTLAMPTHRRALAALAGTLRLHPQESRDVLRDETPRLARGVSDERLLEVLRVAENIPEFAARIPPDVVLRLQNYISNVPPEQRVSATLFSLELAFLRDRAEAQVSTLSVSELADAVKRGLPRVRRHRPVIDRILSLYLNSGSWSKSNDLAQRVILPVIECFTAVDVEAILEAVRANVELTGAFTTNAVLTKLRDAEIVPREAFARLAVARGLDEHFEGLVADHEPTDHEEDQSPS